MVGFWFCNKPDISVINSITYKIYKYLTNQASLKSVLFFKALFEDGRPDIKTLHMSLFKISIAWLCTATTVNSTCLYTATKVNSLNRSLNAAATTKPDVDPFSTEKTPLSLLFLQEWQKTFLKSSRMFGKNVVS